eukprot:scaffold23633_cov124-Isochrysis_galbana.AAC.1
MEMGGGCKGDLVFLAQVDAHDARVLVQQLDQYQHALDVESGQAGQVEHKGGGHEHGWRMEGCLQRMRRHNAMYVLACGVRRRG